MRTKEFNELSQDEIYKMSDDEFDSISPFEKKSCYDCKHIQEYLSIWCGCEEAIELRGTSIPGCIRCPYWKPNWGRISKQYRTEENGYTCSYVKIYDWFENIFKKFKKIKTDK